MSDQPQQNLRHILFKFTMKKKWKEVLQIYEDNSTAHTIILTKYKETAFHIAISSYNSKRPSNRHERSTEEMIRLMADRATLSDVLRMPNERGDTPLHIAAAVGWEVICTRIAQMDCELITNRNEEGETPLFVAAHHGNLKAFRALHEIHVDRRQQVDESLCRRTRDGNTVLHSAISGECLKLAKLIIRLYKNLINSVNVDGETPLHVLARKPNVFPSSSHLGFYESIIYKCVFDDELKQPPKLYPGGKKFPKNYTTCVDVFSLLYKSSRACYGRKSAASTDVEDQPSTEYGAPIYAGFLASCSRSKNKKGVPTNGNVRRNSGSSTDVNSGASVDVEDASTDDEDDAPTDVQDQQYVERSLPINALASGSRSNKQNENVGNQTKGATEKGKYFPPNYDTCVLIFKFVMKVILTILGIGFLKIRNIQEKKVMHSHAMVIMNEMIKFGLRYEYDINGQQPSEQHKLNRPGNIPNSPPDDVEHGTPSSSEANIGTTKDEEKLDKKDSNQSGAWTSNGKGRDTPILVAAKMGIPEIVKKIIREVPVAIQDKDSKGKNVLMVAAENRQTSVFDYLVKKKLPDYFFHDVDNEGNSILHLAAKLGEKQQPWHIPGAALQMQWEIKWYKYVNNSITPLSFVNHNKKGETPRRIFTATHERLVEKGNDWLVKTSESCSLIAALIATVAFATSATVPGGLDQTNGHPMLQRHDAFDIFAIASLVALCLSITALVFFLAIITSRFEESDFERDLPRKLLVGLTCLFSSIAAMLLSFCAGHTFILRRELKIAAVPVYAATTIPVMFFAVAQLPLYFDLLWAACRKVPLRSYSVFHR